MNGLIRLWEMDRERKRTRDRISMKSRSASMRAQGLESAASNLAQSEPHSPPLRARKEREADKTIAKYQKRKKD